MASAMSNFQWRDHKETLFADLNNLFMKNILIDCSIVTMEGRQMGAHRVVLSACSPVFEKMLNIDENQRPIICFPSVTYEEMAAILSFMYRGETSVPEDAIDSFLRVAKFLKVKGFVEPEEDYEIPQPKRHSSGFVADVSRPGNASVPRHLGNKLHYDTKDYASPNYSVYNPSTSSALSKKPPSVAHNGAHSTSTASSNSMMAENAKIPTPLDNYLDDSYEQAAVAMRTVTPLPGNPQSAKFEVGPAEISLQDNDADDRSVFEMDDGLSEAGSVSVKRKNDSYPAADGEKKILCRLWTSQKNSTNQTREL